MEDTLVGAGERKPGGTGYLGFGTGGVMFFTGTGGTEYDDRIPDDDLAGCDTVVTPEWFTLGWCWLCPTIACTATCCNIAPVCFVGTVSVNSNVEFRPSLKPH